MRHTAAQYCAHHKRKPPTIEHILPPYLDKMIDAPKIVNAQYRFYIKLFNFQLKLNDSRHASISLSASLMRRRLRLVATVQSLAGFLLLLLR